MQSNTSIKGKLDSLPRETLEWILSFAGAEEFVYLWRTGSVNLQNRLREIRSLALEWNGSKFLFWPSALFKLAPHLDSFSLRNHPSIKHAGIWRYELETMPSTLQSLTFCFPNCLDTSASLAQLFPNLTYLNLTSSYFKENCRFELPSTLLELHLDCPHVLPLPPLQQLLDRSPNIHTLSVGPFFKVDPLEPIRWPSTLAFLRVWLNLMANAQPQTMPSLSQTFANGLPPSLTHFELRLSMHSTSPLEARQFPWHLLPPSLTYLTCQGNGRPPLELPPRLEVLIHHDGGLSPDQRHEDEREIWRRAPPSLRICHIGDYPSQEEETLCVTFKELESGIVPNGIENIEIKPIPFFTALPPLPTLLTRLSLNGPRRNVIDDPDVVLPSTLKALQLKDASGPFPLLWRLPFGLTSLDLDYHLLSPETGALALPRSLTHLECSTVSFPANSNLADFPPSITSLRLLVTNLRSYIPDNADSDYPMGDMIAITSAAALPKKLQSLVLHTRVIDSVNITLWFSELSPTLPLKVLRVNDSSLIDKCQSFYNLPPTLIELEAPIAHFSGLHFGTLPRGLRTLRIKTEDFHYVDTKSEHIRNLPHGLVALQLAVPASLREEMFYDALHLLRDCRLYIPGKY